MNIYIKKNSEYLQLIDPITKLGINKNTFRLWKHQNKVQGVWVMVNGKNYCVKGTLKLKKNT